MVSNNEKLKRILGILFLTGVIATIIIMAMQAITDDVWYDEVFSMCFSKLNITDIPGMTARDVHPPFYYIYLRLFIIIGQTITGGGNEVVLAKMASVFPWFGLAIISMTYIRKKWGFFTGSFYLFLVTAMPQIGNYYVEIRMYSLALLLITSAGLLALSIIQDDSKKWKWCAFWIIGILTAYTQYYACIGIVGVYAGFMLLIVFLSRPRRKKIWAILGCAIASVIIYIPWMGVVLNQMNNINGTYWIQPLGIKSIFGCIKYIFLPVSLDGRICYVACGLMLFSTATALVRFIIKRERQLLITIICLVIPLIVVVASGFVLSILGTPIFIYRYMVPTLGLFWLAVAIIINRVCDKRLVAYLLLVPYIVGAFYTVRGFYQEENKKVTHMPLVHEAFDKIPENAAVVTNFDHVTTVSGYYLNNDIYIYDGEVDRLIPDMLNGCGSMIVIDDIINKLQSGQPVYFLGSFNTREDIINDWQEYGIIAEEQDSVLLERYWFNIYRLELK